MGRKYLFDAWDSGTSCSWGRTAPRFCGLRRLCGPRRSLLTPSPFDLKPAPLPERANIDLLAITWIHRKVSPRVRTRGVSPHSGKYTLPFPRVPHPQVALPLTELVNPAGCSLPRPPFPPPTTTTTLRRAGSASCACRRSWGTARRAPVPTSRPTRCCCSRSSSSHSASYVDRYL